MRIDFVFLCVLSTAMGVYPTPEAEVQKRVPVVRVGVLDTYSANASTSTETPMKSNVSPNPEQPGESNVSPSPIEQGKLNVFPNLEQPGESNVSIDSNIAKKKFIWQLLRTIWSLRNAATQSKFSTNYNRVAISQVHKGSKYSIQMPKEMYCGYREFSQHYLSKLCGQEGGYLAEINTADEYNFVKDFIHQHARQYNEPLALGTRYKVPARSWRHMMHSRDAVYLMSETGVRRSGARYRKRRCLTISARGDNNMLSSSCHKCSGALCELEVP